MTLNDHYRDAIAHVANVLVHDLAAWHRRDPAAEAVPNRALKRMLREAWPHRYAVVEHDSPRHGEQSQTVLVVPRVMLVALAGEMARRMGEPWPMWKVEKYELED